MHVYKHVHACIQTCMHACMQTCTRRARYACMYTTLCTNTKLLAISGSPSPSVCVYVCVCVCVCVCATCMHVYKPVHKDQSISHIRQPIAFHSSCNIPLEFQSVCRFRWVPAQEEGVWEGRRERGYKHVPCFRTCVNALDATFLHVGCIHCARMSHVCPS